MRMVEEAYNYIISLESFLDCLLLQNLYHACILFVIDE